MARSERQAWSWWLGAGAGQLTDLGVVRTAGGGGALGSPAELRSSGGTLQVELDAARRTVDVAGRRVSMLGYADGVPVPTLRLPPGGPEIAALSMSGSSVIVAVDALLLKRPRLPSQAAAR